MNNHTTTPPLAPAGQSPALALATGSASWTPLHIELMIHYRCSACRFPRSDAPAVIDYTEQLKSHGLIRETTDDETGDYRATEKGEAFLELVCRTPLPQMAWVTPSGELIQRAFS
jgi:hypothetical protein